MEIRNYFKSSYLKRTMKKSILFIFFGLLLLASFSLAEEESDQANNQQIKSSTHPYLNETINHSWFKVIGIPEPLSRKDFIIYLCLFIAVFAIVFEVVNISGIIEQKWINFCVALIVLLLGNYSVNITYVAMNQITNFANIITFFTEIGWIKMIIGIALVTGFFFLLKWGLKSMKGSAEIEKAKAMGDDLKTLNKIKRIEMIGAGMKPSS